MFENKNKLKIGTIVKLKSEESPSMVLNKELPEEMVECIWFNGNICKKEIFHINALFNYENKIEYNLLLQEKLSRMTTEELYNELEMVKKNHD